MLIYSIIPNEVIFSNQDDQYEKTQNITYKGQTLEVTQLAANQYRVNRIISTNIKAYLDPQLQPGTILEYELKNF
ncbi:MAG: YlzJ-like family protein [Clostridia bacterium]